MSQVSFQKIEVANLSVVVPVDNIKSKTLNPWACSTGVITWFYGKLAWNSAVRRYVEGDGTGGSIRVLKICSAIITPLLIRVSRSHGILLLSGDLLVY